jgi:1-acyl-sn-glycerol-3-phosphate acyltransferase
LPMWRKNCGSHALKDLRKRLVDEPCGLILFPEGQRSRDGSLLPFKAGLGMLVAGTAVPVIPCHLDGAFRAFPPNARAPRPRKIRLRIGSPLVFDSVPNARAGWEQVTAQTHAAVRQLGGTGTP